MVLLSYLYLSEKAKLWGFSKVGYQSEVSILVPKSKSTITTIKAIGSYVLLTFVGEIIDKLSDTPHMPSSGDPQRWDTTLRDHGDALAHGGAW